MLEDRDSDGCIRILGSKTLRYLIRQARIILRRQSYRWQLLPFGMSQMTTGVCNGLMLEEFRKIDDPTRYQFDACTCLHAGTYAASFDNARGQNVNAWVVRWYFEQIFKRHQSLFAGAYAFSYLAKRGASFEDRLILGYQVNPMKMVLVYSQDRADRPLALLAHVLNETQGVSLTLTAQEVEGLKQGQRRLIRWKHLQSI